MDDRVMLGTDALTNWPPGCNLLRCCWSQGITCCSPTSEQLLPQQLCSSSTEA